MKDDTILGSLKGSRHFGKLPYSPYEWRDRNSAFNFISKPWPRLQMLGPRDNPYMIPI